MPDERNVHTFPVNDLVEHDTENFDACVCGPDVEFLENGGRLIVHHSLDGRELGEEDRTDVSYQHSTLSESARHEVYVDALDGWAGYQAACRSCGWRGQRYGRKDQARTEMSRHAAREQEWTIWVCPVCARSWHKSTGKPRNFCVGNGQLRHPGIRMEPVRVVLAPVQPDELSAPMVRLLFGGDEDD